MELHNVSDEACPTNIIAIATNDCVRQQHCGIAYTAANGAVRLCDLWWEDYLTVRDVPEDFLWVRVALEDYEVLQIAEFVEFVIRQHHRPRPTPYSFIYGR